MPKYLKSKGIDQIPKLRLEDRQMPHSIVKKQQNIFEYTSNGDYRYISAARTSQPLIASTAAVYFQVHILHCSRNSQIGIGLMHKDCDLNKHPGKNNRSVGFISNGDLYVNKKKEKSLKNFKIGSIVGMGIIFASKQIFVTIDGSHVGSIKISQDTFQTKYCPCVSLRNKDDKIKITFQNFKFDFANFLIETQMKCEQAIQKQPISKSDHYGMIVQYLKFYGYQKTLNKLNEQQVIQNKNYFAQHPFIANKIDLPEDFKSSAKKVQILKPGHTNSQAQIQSNNEKCTPGRQRIMSQIIAESAPVQLGRKRTYDFQRQLFESKRKNSVIQIEDSNMGESQKKQEIHTKFIYNQKTTNFLNNQRIVILAYLRQYKIKQAYTLLLEKLPQVFEVYKFLEGYFQMQCYLYTLKVQGIPQAIKFVKNQNQKFKNYKKEQYPIYLPNGKRQLKSFSYFMSLITRKNLQDCPALADAQFQGFANHINQIILQSLGLYYESRLDLLINHIRTIGRKAQQYQIPGLFQINDI